MSGVWPWLCWRWRSAARVCAPQFARAPDGSTQGHSRMGARTCIRFLAPSCTRRPSRPERLLRRGMPPGQAPQRRFPDPVSLFPCLRPLLLPLLSTELVRCGPAIATMSRQATRRKQNQRRAGAKPRLCGISSAGRGFWRWWLAGPAGLSRDAQFRSTAIAEAGKRSPPFARRQRPATCR